MSYWERGSLWRFDRSAPELRETRQLAHTRPRVPWHLSGRSIDEQAAARRQAAGIRPLGVAAVLAQNPLHRPGKIKKSPAPFVHAATKAMREFLWEGYALFVAAYRIAAERLKTGDPAPPFPVGCFPPALPFVGG